MGRKLGRYVDRQIGAGGKAVRHAGREAKWGRWVDGTEGGGGERRRGEGGEARREGRGESPGFTFTPPLLFLSVPPLNLPVPSHPASLQHTRTQSHALFLLSPLASLYSPFSPLSPLLSPPPPPSPGLAESRRNC